MKYTSVAEGIFKLSANEHDILFESMWPIPEGVSLSSYIVKGDKIAIIDGVCGWDGVPQTLFDQFKQMDLAPEDIDYIIVNHMEPDHSGWLHDFKSKIKDDITIVTHEKSLPLLERFFGIKHDKVMTVKSGDTLDLGAGRVLAFEEIPNVHWPETIATFDTQSGTIFPCDAFGAFGATVEGKMYDDELSDQEIEALESETRRYYSNIVGAFSVPAARAIEKASKLPIKIVAPGHGIVWRKNPAYIVNQYKEYTTYAQGPAKKKITVLWASMYGNTEKAVQPVVDTIKEAGFDCAVHQLPDSENYSYIISDVWESSGVILGSPTYEYKLFPAIAMALEELGNKKAANRRAFLFGSYGWAASGQREFTEIIERKKMKWQILPPVEFKGSPDEDDIAKVKERTRELIAEVNAWCDENKG